MLRNYFAPLLLIGSCLTLLAVWFHATGSELARGRALQFPSGSESRIEWLTRALELNPGNTLARAQRAGAFLESGNVPAADADSQRAEQAFGSVDFTLQCASIARRKGQAGECIQLIEKARWMQPDSPRLLTQLAATFYQQKQYAEAQKVAAELNERAPENVDGLFLLGACATALNQPGRVEFYYQQARNALERGEASALLITTKSLR
ncbi:MAG: hypothetical protein NTX50_06420 [Candidatus Sumerlaeota bacterium]|nr:hypothetical protein [Candidatus Sumerlaeota bacterium]